MAVPASVCELIQRYDGHIIPDNAWNQSQFGSDYGDVSKLNRITYGYIAPIIIIFGIVGDILTVATLTHPLLRKASIVYTYLTLLAMTDLLSLFSVIPMILYFLNIRFCSQLSALYYAHIGFPLVNSLMGASVWIVVCLTLSQYMAVCHPFYFGLLRKRKCCYWLFSLIYVFSFGVNALWQVLVLDFFNVAILRATKRNVHLVPDNLAECSYVICDGSMQNETWFKVYEWLRELITRGCPFLIIAFCNAKILITYRSTKKDRLRRLTSPHQSKNISERSEQEEKRLFSLLFAIVIIFMVCTIPAAPLTIFVSDSRQSEFGFQIFRAITNILEFTKFAMNFYFYCLINPDIRRICYHIVCCKKLKKHAMVKGQPVTLRARNLSNLSNVHGGSYVEGKGVCLKPNGKHHDNFRSKSLCIDNKSSIVPNNLHATPTSKEYKRQVNRSVTDTGSIARYVDSGSIKESGFDSIEE